MENKKTVDIKTGINEFFSAFMSSKDKETEEIHGEVMQRLFNNYGERLEEMSSFYILMKYPFEEALEYLIKMIHPGLSDEIMNDVVFLYTHYDFYEHQIEGLIEPRESFVCVSDKSGWLLDSYLRYLIDGKEIDMNRGEKCFWKPRFGTGEEWVNLMKSLMPFYYGKPVEYLKSMAAFVALNENQKEESS